MDKKTENFALLIIRSLLVESAGKSEMRQPQTLTRQITKKAKEAALVLMTTSILTYSAMVLAKLISTIIHALW
jgi:hypothetical protein